MRRGSCAASGVLMARVTATAAAAATATALSVLAVPTAAAQDGTPDATPDVLPSECEAFVYTDA